MTKQDSCLFELRPWQEGDIDDLVTYANNRKIAENLSNVFDDLLVYGIRREGWHALINNPANRELKS